MKILYICNVFNSHKIKYNAIIISWGIYKLYKKTSEFYSGVFSFLSHYKLLFYTEFGCIFNVKHIKDCLTCFYYILTNNERCI